MMRIVILVLLISTTLKAQLNDFVRFPHQQNDKSYLVSSVLSLQNGDVMMFWTEDNKLYSSRSTDDGVSWSNPQYLFDAQSTEEHSDFVASLLTSSGKLLVIYKNVFVKKIVSTDFGQTWSNPVTVATSGNFSQVSTRLGHLSQTYTGRIIFTYSWDTPGVRYIYSDNDGESWSAASAISPTGLAGSHISVAPNAGYAVYSDNILGRSQLFFRTSNDNGITWSDPFLLLTSDFDDSRPKITRDSSQKLWLVFSRKTETVFAGTEQADLMIVTSESGGTNWSTPERFTLYMKDDSYHSVTLHNNKPLVAFSSSRNSYNDSYFQFYFGTAGVTQDQTAPPAVYQFYHIPEQPDLNEPITFRCYTDDALGIQKVMLISNLNNQPPDTLIMYDDGLHGDLSPGDQVFGVIMQGLKVNDELDYSIEAVSVSNGISRVEGSLNLLTGYGSAEVILDINRLKVPLDNRGIIADVGSAINRGIIYDEGTVIFSGGFWLSGKNNGQLWANGVSSASRVFDYQPGPVGTDPNNQENSVYVIKSTDTHFGIAWQEYRYAVDRGASFYDGDGDGIYNPVDLNGNGVWDLNEDRPDILGDFTAWTVFNDGVPPAGRRWQSSSPQGIEIHQTVFGVGHYVTGPIENTIFVRYRIINKGTVANHFDSCYFSIYTDGDLGDYIDDMVATDTILNSGYYYNYGPDHIYGNNTPAVFLTYLQGPAAYIPGITFIDNNSNGIYDPGIDVPLDSAKVNNGLFLGSSYLQGAKNLDMTSSVQFIKSHPTNGEPSLITEVRSNMLGLSRMGALINPCSWPFGQVIGVPCGDVNPRFIYSGDPVTNHGWLCNAAIDQRMIQSTGPFDLRVNEPIDIWIAYTGGRGNDHLSSITTAKYNVNYANNYYKSNFTSLPSFADELPVAGSYLLEQNYPNPFNPTTTIRYSVPETGLVTLKVYDILGREVATLVNEQRTQGTHEAIFNASGLSSGIYIYEIRAGSYYNSRKMVLLK